MVCAMQVHTSPNMPAQACGLPQPGPAPTHPAPLGDHHAADGAGQGHQPAEDAHSTAEYVERLCNGMSVRAGQGINSESIGGQARKGFPPTWRRSYEPSSVGAQAHWLLRRANETRCHPVTPTFISEVHRPQPQRSNALPLDV